MDFTAEELEGVVKDQRMEADGHVRARGLVIGEDHDNPHGRGLIGNLIQQGSVKNLFLEVPDYTISFVDEGAAFGNPGEKVSEWLRRKAKDGVDLGKDEEWGRFKVNLRDMMFLHDAPHEAADDAQPNFVETRNKARMVSLIEFAVKRGVPVYFADRDRSLDKTGVSPVSPEGMKARDAHIVESIRKVAPETRSGCVILVGKSHGANGRFGSLNMGRMEVVRSQALGPRKKP